ncbi:MAG: hypothetical protein MZW92_20515, partial [Comamonadaceae bacterium]|nr:hypothetical protein [Comamonadaceae bacterium]
MRRRSRDVAGGGPTSSRALRRQADQGGARARRGPARRPGPAGRSRRRAPRRSSFLVVGDLFLTDTGTRRARRAPALGAPSRPSGTLTNQERRVQRVERADPAAQRPGDVAGPLRSSPARMGYRFKMKYGSLDEEVLSIPFGSRLFNLSGIRNRTKY